MPRKILHLDMDAFFCSVEELHNPSLHGKPFAVGGRPEARGVVASCSYAARAFGVHSAMPMRQAVKLCSELIIVPNRRSLYAETSERVMAYLGTLTPLLEQLSIDEAFLDVSALPEPAETLAFQVQQTINKEFNLPCSLGVATNKLVAKIANNVGKAIRVVPPGQEAAFLAPLPVRELFGVGPKTAERLRALGVQTIGDLAAWPADLELVQHFGKAGYDLARRARGLDDRSVEPVSETKSVSQEMTFERDVREAEKLRQTLLRLSEGVARQLRQEGLRGRTVKVKLCWSDFTTLTRQTTLKMPTDQAVEVYQVALRLFEKAWDGNRLVRLLGVGVSQFAPVQRQLELWEAPSPPDVLVPAPLQKTLDQLQQRFGEGVVRRGKSLRDKQ